MASPYYFIWRLYTKTAKKTQRGVGGYGPPAKIDFRWRLNKARRQRKYSIFAGGALNTPLVKCRIFSGGW